MEVRLILIALYLLALVGANLPIDHFGHGAANSVGFVAIGLDLTTQDSLQQRWQALILSLNMVVPFHPLSVLSYLLNRNAGPIAFASLVAFGAAGLVDAIVYHLLRDKARLVKVNGSNILSAAVDSLVFPTLAFGGLLPWVTLGQFLAKVLGGFVWSMVLMRAPRGMRR